MRNRITLVRLLCIAIFIICFIGIIVSMLNFRVYADDSYVTGGHSTSTITFTQPSDYCIIIPETIDASAGAYVFQAGQLNITENERVLVTVTSVNQDGRITFTHENGENTLTKEIVTENISQNALPGGLPENCVGYFTPDSISSKLSFGLTEESYDYEGYIKAGNYTALVEFNIYLEGNNN